ncbi:MAG TPA: WcaI family glycosyltransferase [Chthoniobacteraceae bacterium]|jgi:colanic acid biosynthesis glycosyl transferase WcaI|nr:WcaI family glycosyltransferase [Chthoniobacteraceae bacterium]
MRVLVWGINYDPEQVGIAPYNAALCEYLARQGHDVEMVTTFPYYPMWKKAEKDRGRLYRSDVIRNVRVRRCWHFVPAQPSGFERIMHEASFVYTSFLRVLSLRRADVMVVVSPPLLLGAAAWLAGALKRTPHVLHVQDLQPDAAVGLGILEDGWFIEVLRALERFNYGAAARVSVISEGMLRILEKRGVKRLLHFPNWIVANGPAPARGAFRQARGIGPGEFLILYSGNIGMKQGLELIVEAVSRIDGIRLIICGDGAGRSAVAKMIDANGSRNVTLLPLQPDAEYRRMMVDADVCVISQRSGGGAAFFPSKLFSCVALGRPVLAVADAESELARVVQEHGLGVWVAPEMDALVTALRDLQRNRAQLENCEANGKKFAERYEEARVLPRFEAVLREVASG